MSDLVKLPTAGFARGAVVRKFGTGPNMLVVRGLGETTAVIVIEDDKPGSVRLAELATSDLEQVLPDHGTQDREFDLRWKADMRAIKRWQEANPGNDLVWPDHADLVVWLADRDKEAAARIEQLEGENARLHEALARARVWHKCEDKALSKSGRADANYYWQRAQHQEQIDKISAALAGKETA